MVIGDTIGPYSILGRLGEGGMGEVYRARDTKLNRDVAIKVLLPSVANDPDRLARFSREAQVLASLNHPNIAAIYGIEETSPSTGSGQGGVTALVMELVEGEDLAQRIARGAIPIDEALPIARQIAEALDAAHELGIIHRDLKPANIKVRPDGTVKVLDFGLAKAVAPDGHSSANAINSPTLSIHATEAGVILGTAAYMSPEQAAGKSIDKRSDLWAFGVVLFEVLSGRQMFAGETVSHVLAAVLKDQPDWSALPIDTPAAIRKLLRRCLEKERTRRMADAADVRLEIDEVLASPGGAHPENAIGRTTVGARRSLILAWSAAALCAVAAATLGAAVLLRSEPSDVPAFRSTILLNESLDGRPPANRFALSPNGNLLVYVGAASGSRVVSLWLRPLDGIGAQRLEGTNGASSPFWSPDGRFVAFHAGGTLKKIAVSGGTPIAIANAPSTADSRGSSGTWSPDDVIVYPAADFSALVRVSSAGGTPVAVTTVNRAAGETDHSYPYFLPDGRHFLYAAFNGVMPLGVYVGSIDAQRPVRLLEGVSGAQYANGSLIFVQGTTLMVRPFDATTLTFAGEATPVAERIQMSTVTQRASAFSASANGVLVYQTGAVGGTGRLVWADRAGTTTAVLDDIASYRDVTLAPDGQTASVSVFDTDRASADIWIVDVVRRIRTRFTFDPTDELAAIWSPGGNDVVFNSRRKGHLDLYRKTANGSGAEELLLGDQHEKAPTSWSPDRQHILFTKVSGDTGYGVWALPVSGTRTPVPFADTPFDEQWGQFSPDGRWVAYTSTESGRREVYVAPFRGPGGKTQISLGGGNYPRWRRDGTELFYHSPDDKLMAAAVRADAVRIDVQSVRPLFEMRAPSGGLRNFYDVSPDGQRFLLSVSVDAGAATPVTLLTNWPALVTQAR